MSWFKKLFGIEDEEPVGNDTRRNGGRMTTPYHPQNTGFSQRMNSPHNSGFSVGWNPNGERSPYMVREIPDEQLEILRSPNVHAGNARKESKRIQNADEPVEGAPVVNDAILQKGKEGQYTVEPIFKDDKQAQYMAGPIFKDEDKFATGLPQNDTKGVQGETATTGKATTGTEPPKIEVVREETKLIVILVENTAEVAKEKEKLEQIVKSLANTGHVCVINYGTTVREGAKIEATSFNSNTIICNDDIGDKACLYDALITTESVIKKYYNSVVWLKFKRARITSVEIIGIGRCIDNYSFNLKSTAINAFENTVISTKATTKYFCLSEENFIDAATIGFRSIGSISRSYY